MTLYKIYTILFVLKTSLCACDGRFSSQKANIEKVGKLPSILNECSGIIKYKDGFLSHNDSGGEPVLYYFAKDSRNIQDEIKIKGAHNQDWEDLTQDTAGNIYIGDFGNNNQSRKNLVIYKFSKNNTEKISFEYQDQTESAKKDFDCEAFFWYNHKLYLFTKSWEKQGRISKLYLLDDKPGNYGILPTGAVKIPQQVTGAAISPDETKFALLTYGKIYLFEIKNKTINFDHPLACIKIHKGQSEAIVFEDPQTIIYTTEKGKMYKIEI